MQPALNPNTLLRNSTQLAHCHVPSRVHQAVCKTAKLFPTNTTLAAWPHQTGGTVRELHESKATS